MRENVLQTFDEVSECVEIFEGLDATELKTPDPACTRTGGNFNQ